MAFSMAIRKTSVANRCGGTAENMDRKPLAGQEPDQVSGVINLRIVAEASIFKFSSICWDFTNTEVQQNSIGGWSR